MDNRRGRLTGMSPHQAMPVYTARLGLDAKEDREFVHFRAGEYACDDFNAQAAALCKPTPEGPRVRTGTVCPSAIRLCQIDLLSRPKHSALASLEVRRGSPQPQSDIERIDAEHRPEGKLAY